jgi:hypothetical protein
LANVVDRIWERWPRNGSKWNKLMVRNFVKMLTKCGTPGLDVETTVLGVADLRYGEAVEVVRHRGDVLKSDEEIEAEVGKAEEGMREKYWEEYWERKAREEPEALRKWREETKRQESRPGVNHD